MNHVLTHQTLGELVADRPGAARILDRVGIDYCCAGRRTLAEAAVAAGLDAAALAAAIARPADEDDTTWSTLGPVELAEHIVDTHHRYLREELLALELLAEKVEGAHRSRHPELARVRELVGELRADLEPHLDKEEACLFPAIRALVEDGRRSFPFGAMENPIEVMTVEHERAGELLATIRRVTDGFVAPPDACTSYRVLYERLEALEHDTHVHIHKENHVLFPAALRAWQHEPATL